jgi:abhydrolase domain-containing protein 17
LFLREKTNGSSKLLIYFHGNAEDIGLSYRDLDILKKSLKINVLAMEYPGYGVYNDPDGCSADKIKEDSEYVYKYILQETGISESDIIIFGRSIGTGPAIHVSSLFNPGSLCLMSAYTSIR